LGGALVLAGIGVVNFKTAVRQRAGAANAELQVAN
jgi:hypothetical protein